jgi:hypothetical protein
MEIAYTFVCGGPKNYMHPVGFCPYQAYAMWWTSIQLEPSVVAPAMHDMDMDTAMQRAAGACVAGGTCPAPPCIFGRRVSGVYSNIPEKVKNVTSGEQDFGPGDAYEPLFSNWANGQAWTLLASSYALTTRIIPRHLYFLSM